MKYVRNFDSFRENRKSEHLNEEIELLKKIGQGIVSGWNYLKGKVKSVIEFLRSPDKRLLAIEALLPTELVNFIKTEARRVNPKAATNESLLLEEASTLTPEGKKLFDSLKVVKDKASSPTATKEDKEAYKNLLEDIAKNFTVEINLPSGDDEVEDLSGEIGEDWKEIRREDFDSEKEYQEAKKRIQAQGQSQAQEEPEIKPTGQKSGSRFYDEEGQLRQGNLEGQPEWVKKLCQDLSKEKINPNVSMVAKSKPSMDNISRKIDKLEISPAAKKTIKTLSFILFFGLLFLKGTSGMAATAGHAPGDGHKFTGDDHKDVKDVKGDKGKVGDDKGKEGEKGKDGKKMTSKEKQEAKKAEIIKKYGDPRNFFEKLMGKKLGSTHKTVSEKNFKVTKSMQKKGINSIEDYVKWLQTDEGGGWTLDSEKVETIHQVMLENAPEQPVNVLEGDINHGDVKEGSIDLGDDFKSGKFELKGEVRSDIEKQVEEITAKGGIITGFVVVSSTDTQPVGDGLAKALKAEGLSGDNIGLADARINAISDVLNDMGVDDGMIAKKPLPNSGEEHKNWDQKTKDLEQPNRFTKLHVLYYTPDSDTKPAEDFKPGEGKPVEKTVDKEVKVYQLGKATEVKKHKGGGGGGWRTSGFKNQGGSNLNVSKLCAAYQ